jgi:hypothetical protein
MTHGIGNNSQIVGKNRPTHLGGESKTTFIRSQTYESSSEIQNGRIYLHIYPRESGSSLLKLCPSFEIFKLTPIREKVDLWAVARQHQCPTLESGCSEVSCP